MTSEEFSPFGNDLFGEPIRPENPAPLSKRFLFPPFSVLDARGGEWQDRKRAWLEIGIQSELGRGADGDAYVDSMPGGGSTSEKSAWMKKPNNGLLGFSEQARSHYRDPSPGGSPRPAMDYSNRERGDGAGKPLAGPKPGLTWVGGDREFDDLDETSQKILAAGSQSGTSIFDPVLTELAYTWFCRRGGQIIDPFAGGSVRGIVAAMLGFKYWGCDLRGEQIAANEIQREEICKDAALSWVCGDSIEKVVEAPEADFLFSCPPYGDLERYSDDPLDLSTMSYEGFMEAYRKIIKASASRLKENRFACFVVGDYRDRKSGNYRGFVKDTITAFEDAGMFLYNDGILVTAVGSLSIRVGKQFDASRKLGKTHQNVLVFVKGDGKKAAKEVNEGREL